jgi:hypothetical protein
MASPASFLSRSALRARDDLVLQHLPLVDSIASAAARRLFPLVERDHLMKVAREALVCPAPRCRFGEPAAPFLRLLHHRGPAAPLARSGRLVRISLDAPAAHHPRWSLPPGRCGAVEDQRHGVFTPRGAPCDFSGQKKALAALRQHLVEGLRRPRVSCQVRGKSQRTCRPSGFMNQLPRLLGAAGSHSLLTGQIIFSTAFVGACDLPNRIQAPRQVNVCRSRSSALALFFPSGMPNLIRFLLIYYHVSPRSFFLFLPSVVHDFRGHRCPARRRSPPAATDLIR